MEPVKLDRHGVEYHDVDGGSLIVDFSTNLDAVPYAFFTAKEEKVVCVALTETQVNALIAQLSAWLMRPAATQPATEDM